MAKLIFLVQVFSVRYFTCLHVSLACNYSARLPWRDESLHTNYSWDTWHLASGNMKGAFCCRGECYADRCSMLSSTQNRVQQLIETIKSAGAWKVKVTSRGIWINHSLIFSKIYIRITCYMKVIPCLQQLWSQIMYTRRQSDGQIR